MITPSYVRYLARYNRWQNEAVFACAGTLPESELSREAGAFFGSISGTLNHLLWADRMWMHRFAGWPRPEGSASDRQCDSWAALADARRQADAAIVAWADRLDAAWLAGDFSWYSGLYGRELTAPASIVVGHMFNHQTHHRGQVHCLLTQAGLDPGVTDLQMLPRDLWPDMSGRT